MGELRVDQVKRLKQLEQENTRLPGIVSDQSLDILILKRSLRGKLLKARRGAEMLSSRSSERLGCLSAQHGE
jgi:hypothetical protein